MSDVIRPPLGTGSFVVKPGTPSGIEGLEFWGSPFDSSSWKENTRVTPAEPHPWTADLTSGLELWLRSGQSPAWKDPGRTLAASTGDTLGAMDDLSGNSRHATQVTASKELDYVAVSGGRAALENDATRRFLNVANNVVFTTLPLTFVIRAKWRILPSVHAGESFIYRQNHSAFPWRSLDIRGISIGGSADKIEIELRDVATTKFGLRSLSTISADIWYTIILMIDSSGAAEFFLNGVSQSTVTIANLFINDGSSAIGGLDTAAANYIDGQISDVLFYSKVLKQPEIDELQNYLPNNTITLGDSVGALDDLSGNGRHLIQATAGNRPIYTADQFGRLPGLIHDGTDSFIWDGSITLAGDITLVAYVKNTITNYNYMLVLREVSTAYRMMLDSNGLNDRGRSKIVTSLDGNAISNGPATDIKDGNPHLLIATYNRTGKKLLCYVDGVAGVEKTLTGELPTVFDQIQTGATYTTGDALIYSRLLSANEIADLTNYYTGH